MSKRKSRAQASRKKTTRQIPGWLWLLTGMIVGAFVMFIVHLSELKKTQTAPTETASEPTPSAQKKDEKEEKVFTPVFEFYESLKKDQVEIPDYAPPKEEDIQITHEFFLQVASFRRESDAESARARLILMNLNANIEPSKLQSGATTYRVIVGPYTSKSKLAKARQTLVSNGFEYLTLKREI